MFSVVDQSDLINDIRWLRQLALFNARVRIVHHRKGSGAKKDHDHVEEMNTKIR